VRAVRALLVPIAVVLSSCGGPDERACGLVEDLPAQAGQTSPEELQEVAKAAREAASPELRTLGEELTANLARRRALESLAPGAFLDVLQANLDAFRGACRDLETTDEDST
jgi:hypothetical protein